MIEKTFMVLWHPMRVTKYKATSALYTKKAYFFIAILTALSIFLGGLLNRLFDSVGGILSAWEG